MAKILLVDDEELLREVVRGCLAESGYEVYEAVDGQAAVDFLQNQSVELVVSDIRMPRMSGVELLQWVKKNKPQIPVVLITAFSELMATQQAAEMGASGFLTKPFREADLKSILQEALSKKHLSGEQVAEGLDLDRDYCRLNIEDFVTGARINYNIHIRINKGKYIRIAHTGADISLEQIRAYKSKNVAYLYLTREDFKTYLKQSLVLSKKVQESSFLSPEKKLNFMKHTGEVLMEEIMVEGLSPETFFETRAFVESAMESLSSEDTIFNLLTLLNEHSEALYAHSLGTSIYATMIARQLGWSAVPTKMRVAMAGLFHDMGKKEIDPKILEKPRHQMNQRERAIYESHCIRGAEILSLVEQIPEQVIQAALQHHEDCKGHGFPNHIGDATLPPLSRLISVANEFCNLVIRNPSMKNPVKPKDAIIQLFQIRKDALDPVFLGALAKIFDVRPPT